MAKQQRSKRIRFLATAVSLGVIAVLVTAVPALATAPTLLSLSVSSGPPGTGVTITGNNFMSPPATQTVTSVTFNGVAAAFTATSNTTISTSVPCGATSGNVVVTNADGNSGSPAAAAFTVTAAGAPTVSSFSPGSGQAGTVVIITGSGFCGASQVRFNQTAASAVTINSSTQITATVPTGATSGRISVVTAAGTGTSATNFVIGPPVISSFNPTIGPVGTAVTITGSNFTGVTAVRFNGLTASFTVTSDTQITTTVPSSATTGPVTVTNAVGTSTGATFTVGIPSHDRSVTFSFGSNSRVTGVVNVPDGFAACMNFVPVVIQKKSGNGWKWVDTTSTSNGGSYKTYIPPSSGTFRAKINKLTLINGSTCDGDTSPTRHHNA